MLAAARIAGIVCGSLLALTAASVGAAATDDLLTIGPTVSIEEREVEPGDAVIVTFAGFESRAVTITVCGNEGRRGSSDCNMRAAKAREIDPDAFTTQVRFAIAAPPTPCPCLLRVANSDQTEVAVLPIELVGHPVADPVDPVDPGPLVVAEISASTAPDGTFDRLRTALGGSTTYDVTITVRSVATTPLHGLSAAASVGRDADDDLAIVEIGAVPSPLEPGQSWEQVVSVELPTPVWGSVDWRLLVSGAGPAVATDTTTSNRPTALYVLAAVLVFDIAFILFRSHRRKRRGRVDRRDRDRPRQVIDIDEDGRFAVVDELEPDADSAELIGS